MHRGGPRPCCSFAYPATRSAMCHGSQQRTSVRAMTDHEVSRFGHVDLEDMPDDLRERIGAVAEKSGFVPNVFRALAKRPRELRAFLDYHDALMDSDEGLSKAERELIVVATSGANRCTYCVVAHVRSCASAPRTPRSPTRSPRTRSRPTSARASKPSSNLHCCSRPTPPPSPTAISTTPATPV